MPEYRSRPSDQTGTAPCYTDNASVTAANEPISYLEHFGRRVLLDALAEAAPAYWRRRAEALRAARHNPTSDYLPPERLQAARARWAELTAAADACDNKATFLEAYGRELFAADVAAVMAEGVAAA